MKRTITRLALVAACLVGGFAALGALAHWLVDLDALVQEQLARQLPEVEESLGRPIQVGDVSTRFFPTLGATIREVRVGPAADDADGASPLEIGGVGFDLDLWGAIASWGQEVKIREVFLEGVRVHVERREDGTLSIADLLDRPSDEEDADETEGVSPETLELLERLGLDVFRVSDARVQLVDHTAPGGPVTHVIDRIDFRAGDLRLGGTVDVRLQAAVFAQQQNLDLAFAVGPIPADLRFDGLPPVRDLRARVQALDLAPASAFLPAELEAGGFEADLRLPALAPGAPAQLQGHVAVQGLRFAGGQATDVRLDADLQADLEKLGVRIDTLRLRVGAAEVVASGALHDLGEAPRFENFLVRSKNLDPADLLAAFPQAAEGLPAGSRVAGPAALEVRASGSAQRQTLAGSLDLGQVDIHLPGLLAKARGTPFALRIDGDFSSTGARLRQARLQLDEVDLEVSGEVRDFGAPTYDFVIGARPFSMDRLARLIPEAAAQMQEAQVKAQGKGSLSGHIKGKPGEISANLGFALREMELDLPDTTLRGALEARAYVQGDPAGRLQAGLRIDGGDSVIRIPGVLNKAASTPLLLDVVADKRGERIDFTRATLRLAELEVHGKGALGAEGAALDLELQPLDLAKLATTVPAIPAERVAGAHVEGALRLQGDPAAPATMVAELRRFAMKMAGSDLQATATIRNFEAPRIEADLQSRFLDLDALLPEEEDETAEAAEREDDPSLRAISAVARFDLQRVRLRERILENLRGRLVLEDGVFRIEEGHFGLYGGRVDAAGTEMTIWRGALPFHARLNAKGVDVGRLLVGESARTPLLTGSGNLHLDLAGEGFSVDALAESLSGGWNLGLLGGRISTAPITSSILGGLAELPGITPQRLASEGDLRDLLAEFVVEGGRMNLRQPLRMELDGSRVELGGAVGVVGDLFLDGKYFLSPAVVSRVTGGRCRPESEMAVPLRIGGSMADPSISTEGGGLVAAVARTCLAAEAREAIGRMTGGAVQQAVDELDARREAARQEAEAAAAAARADAERKAEEARQKARDEAERARREAESKAKEKARDAGDSLRKKLGF